jgi:hypothetical protein
MLKYLKAKSLKTAPLVLRSNLEFKGSSGTRPMRGRSPRIGLARTAGKALRRALPAVGFLQSRFFFSKNRALGYGE